MTTKNKAPTWERYVQGTESQFLSSEIPLGPWTSHSLKTDPIHMSFVLARYKFCAKMLIGKERVVEIGCGDGFGIPLIAQHVGHLHCVDWDPRNVEGCKRRLSHLKNVTYECIDLNEKQLSFKADAAYLLDVIEHIEPSIEDRFIQNVLAFLKPSSLLLVGTPNITAAAYASPQSVSQHINLKSMQTLRSMMEAYFKHTLMFGMNDEVLHTGYGAMCHYLFSLGIEKK